MRKLLLFAFAIFLSGSMMAQVAVTIDPPDATAWDEITLYLDVSLSCPDSGLLEADTVAMHSGVTIDGAAWSNVVAFDGMGANGEMPYLTKMESAYALTMEPANATAWDEITLTLDANISCPEGGLVEADSVMMHSGVTIDGAAWSNVVEFNGVGANGMAPKFESNGDGTWSMTFIPAEFYGIEEGTNVESIDAVFNGGDWSLGEAKAFDDDGNCTDFKIPFGGGAKAANASTVWMITFTPADYYGVEEGANVEAIDCVFNGGAWDAGEAKDFDPETGDCVDFKILLEPSGIFEAPNVVTFNIYPNPAHTVLNIENMDNASKVEIFNVVGSVIKSVEVGSQNASIDVSDLNKGIYFVSVYNEEGVQTTKFVKE